MSLLKNIEYTCILLKNVSIHVIFTLILKVFLTFIIVQLFIWYIWFDFTEILNIFTKGSEMETTVFADSYHFMILWKLFGQYQKNDASPMSILEPPLVSYKLWYFSTILYSIVQKVNINSSLNFTTRIKSAICFINVKKNQPDEI